MAHIRGTPDRVVHSQNGEGAPIDSTTLAKELTLQDIRSHVDSVEAKLQSLIDATPTLTLTARMFARQPTSGYRIWLDTADVNFIYIAENVAAAVATDATFRGIRIPLTLGNPVGEVQENTAFRWSDKGLGTWT